VAHPPVSVAAPATIQAARLSSPRDPAEREAESTAKTILRMPAPLAVSGFGRSAAAWRSPVLARLEDAPILRKAEGQPNVSANLMADIQSSMASGNPLPLSVRRFMEPRFAANFSRVRVHTDDRAARLSRRVSAQAFTVGNHIFFGRDRYQPESEEGRELIAHELTHTIQQGAAVQRRPASPVMERASGQVQRLGLRDALDYFADRVDAIPGFRMFTIVLGVNPVTMSRVERSAANIFRAVVEFIPGGVLITRALDNYGIFDRVGSWVEQQIRALGMVGSSIREAVMRFLNTLSWRDIFDLGGVWNRARRIFTEPINRIISFVRGLAAGILRFIRDAILRPLAGLARGTRGYDLLCAVLGRDPITGDPVPRTAETLIGGFMRLIGQEEVWNNIRRANAVARAWAWFQGALAGLMGFVRQVPTLFLQALQQLEIADLILLPRAFMRVGRVFAGFAGRFFSWAGSQVMQLLQIIFEVVAPGAMVYIRRAAGAFRTIIRNPVGFVRNLVRAGIQGFRQFATNFLTHLRTSLINWLTGTLSGSGVYIPQAFTLREIIRFVLSVLGLTWQNIRTKLLRVIPEPAVRALETGFDLVRTLVTQGPAAAWEQIRQGITNLREMVMEQIMQFVAVRIVQAAITRLVTSLNPAGAFIQAIIAIYNTIMFFVERLRQIAQVARSFIDSIAAIAGGVIAAAANRVERTMAGLLTLVISFLARLVGLGRVSDAVTRIINRIRAPIDRALDRVVHWIVAQARRLGRLVTGRGREERPDAASGARLTDTEVGEAVSFSAGREGHRLWVDTTGGRIRVMVASNGPGPVEEKLNQWSSRVNTRPEGERGRITGLINTARGLLGNTTQTATQAQQQMRQAQTPAATPQMVQQAQAADDRTEQRERELVNTLRELFVLFGEAGTLPTVGPHPLQGTDRESHHVPANELSGVLAESYQAVGNHLAATAGVNSDMQPLAALATDMRTRSTQIRSGYPGGNNLSAILVHRDTHRTGGRAVHRGSIMGDVEREIQAAAANAPTKRVIVMTSRGTRMVANLRNTHWQAFMQQVYAIERRREGEAGTELANVSVSSGEMVVRVQGGNRGGIQAIANQMEGEIMNTATTVGITPDQARTGYSTLAVRLRQRVNGTMRSAFDNALNNGAAAIRVALSSSTQDGDPRLHGPILGQLRTLARNIWSNIIRPL